MDQLEHRHPGGSSTDTELWRGFRDLYARLSPQRRRQFVLLLVLMLAGACAELASIGAIVPFLALLADPDGLSHFPWAARLFTAVGAVSASERLLIATVVFSVLVLASGCLRLLLAWYTQDFVFRLGHEISLEIHRRLLFQPYSFHIDRHTTSLVSALNKAEAVIFEFLMPLMQAAIAAFISLFIIATLIYINAGIAIGVAVVISLAYVLISGLTRARLRRNSAVMSTSWDDRLKVVQESLEGIRDVILDNAQPVHLKLFDRENLRLSQARANTAFLASAPRFLIEALGMVVIAATAVAISQAGGGLAVALPVLGAIALGAQRLLPLLQQIYSAWSTAAGNQSILLQLLDLLRLPVITGEAQPVKRLPFAREITLENVSFTYPARRRRAIDGLNIQIPAGSSLALVGETGSGKSTLADLVMGLLDPDTGRVLIDGVPLGPKNRRSWQQAIAHVPQSIFIPDSSIAWNIALSAPHLPPDRNRIVEAAEKAQLHEFITSLPQGYETVVGERGVRLSGGQRQRLGLARAIYKGAPLLVLDEATSALDEATEAAVLRSLEELRSEGRTIIVIAHRPSTIRGCDLIVRLNHGEIDACGSFTELFRSGAGRA